ncbi:MAG: hypothetical protein N3F09_07325 [Bacteroidia bacterium]|nr:hypothetical protein [Bacteroidia bacterium]
MKKMTLIVSVILIWMWSCKKDKHLKPVPPPNNNLPELITGIRLVFKDSVNPTSISYALFADPDGPGGNNPTVKDSVLLLKNKTYLVSVQLMDHTKNPVDTLTDQIWNERNEHQFFYHFQGVSIQFYYMDKDDNHLPVGISTKWKTGNSSGIGSVRVILKHQAGGIKNGTEPPGETDVDVTFPMAIK